MRRFLPFLAGVCFAFAAGATGAQMPTNAVSPGATAPKSERVKRPAKITSATTYYDRKEGFAVFSGRVCVDDEDYQMHADRAYVFLDGTNQLRRIVAMGGVALTNETRRAYGTKASYYRESGMVVLSGDKTRIAEVRDEAKDPPQVVRGSKIKFWVNAEQVEVVDATITAPTQGVGAGMGIGSGLLK